MDTKIGNTVIDKSKLPTSMNPINILIMPPISHQTHPRGRFLPAETQRETIPAKIHIHPKICEATIDPTIGQNRNANPKITRRMPIVRTAHQ